MIHQSGIRRVRSGCTTCKLRRRKCDESLPRCSLCARLDVDCDRRQNIRFKHSTVSRAPRVESTAMDTQVQSGSDIVAPETPQGSTCSNTPSPVGDSGNDAIDNLSQLSPLERPASVDPSNDDEQPLSVETSLSNGNIITGWRHTDPGGSVSTNRNTQISSSVHRIIGLLVPPSTSPTLLQRYHL